MSKITKQDYINILKFYKKPIPNSYHLIKMYATKIMNDKLCRCITPFYISNADFNDIKKIKKYKINSRNFTYDGLTFSSSVFILEEVKDEI